MFRLTLAIVFAFCVSSPAFAIIDDIAEGVEGHADRRQVGFRDVDFNPTAEFVSEAPSMRRLNAETLIDL